MKNQFYRLFLTNNMKLELSYYDDSEDSPESHDKMLAICVYGKDLQFDAMLYEDEIDSLIDYLKRIKDEIKKDVIPQGKINR